MNDFQKAVSALRAQGLGVTVENFDCGIQEATIKGDNVQGGFATNAEALLFTAEEVSIIREVLSDFACGYERNSWSWDCCETNEIIKKIDSHTSILERG